MAPRSLRSLVRPHHSDGFPTPAFRPLWLRSARVSQPDITSGRNDPAQATDKKESEMRIRNKRTDRNIPKTAIYVGRPTQWGNPFGIGRDGDRKTVIEKYRRWLWKRIQDGRIDPDQLAALAGKDLVCHCAPEPCHAEVLARAAQ